MTNNQNDLADRIILANEKLVFADGTYVLAILNRALRGEDNPIIDAACLHAKELNIGLVVYSELDETVAYASDRLFYFALGAFRELAQTLAAENIQCVQGIDKTGKGEQVRSLINQAAVVYMYEEHTHWDKAKIDKVLKTAFQTVYLVDASRLVPTRKLPLDLKTTPEFRKTHGKLRDKYAELRKVETEITANTTIITEQNFAEIMKHSEN